MTRQVVEHFATALEARSAGLDARLDDELRTLLAVANRLDVLPVRPDAQFKTDLRERLIAAAPVAHRSVRARVGEELSSWRMRRALTIAVGCAAAVVLLVGIVLGAARAVPGDPLYAVRRGAESIRVTLARSDSARAGVHRDLAQRRMYELRILAGRGDLAGATALLDALDAETVAASRLSVTPADRAILRDFAAAQYAELTGLVPAFDTQLATRARASLQLLESIIDSAGGAASTGATTPADLPSGVLAPAGGGVPAPGGVPLLPVAPATAQNGPADSSAAGPGQPASTGGPSITPAPAQSPAATPRSVGAVPGALPTGTSSVLPTASVPDAAGPTTSLPSDSVSTASVPTLSPTAPQPTVGPAPQPTVGPGPQATVGPGPQATVGPGPQPTVSPAPQPTASIPPLPSESVPPPTESPAPLPSVPSVLPSVPNVLPSAGPLPTVSAAPLPTTAPPALPSLP